MPAIRSTPARAPVFNPYARYATSTSTPTLNPITHNVPVPISPRVPDLFERTRVDPSHGVQRTHPSHKVLASNTNPILAPGASHNTSEIDRMVVRDLADKAKFNEFFEPSALQPNVQVPTRNLWSNYRREAAIQHALLRKERQLGYPLKSGSKEMIDFLYNLDHEAALSDLRDKAGNGFPHAIPNNTTTIHNTRDYHIETAVRIMHGKREHEIYDERGATQKLWPEGDNTKLPQQQTAALKKQKKQMADLKARLQAADAVENEKLPESERINFDFAEDEMEILAGFATTVKSEAAPRKDDRRGSATTAVSQPRARRSPKSPKRRQQPETRLEIHRQEDEKGAWNAVHIGEDKKQGLPVAQTAVEPIGVQIVDQQGRGSPRNCNKDKTKILNSRYLDNNLREGGPEK